MSSFTKEDCLTQLKNIYGYDSFRPNQYEMIENLLAGKDGVMILATSGGKSMNYQFPPIMKQIPAIIISPLIALMDNQEMSLNSIGVTAIALHSNKSISEDQIKQIEVGYYKVIFVSPEKIATESWMKTMDKMVDANLICLFAVDESHMVSQYGHDFRPTYRELHILRTKYPSIPILATTATATVAVQNDIVSQLKLINPLIIRSSINRNNLCPAIYKKTKSIIGDLQSVTGILDNPEKSILIYASTKAIVEKICAELRDNGYNAVFYHAGLSAEIRRSIFDDFMGDKVKIVVATNCFGVGLDKSDVAAVVVYGIPSSIEELLQLFGRVREDVELCPVVLFYNYGDYMSRKFMIEGSKTQTNQETSLLLFNQLYQFLQSKKCRRKAFAEYFSEDSTNINCTERNACDVCATSVNVKMNKNNNKTNKSKQQYNDNDSSTTSLSPIELNIFNSLTAWRKQQATQTGVSLHQIFSNKTLVELSKKRPIFYELLTKIHGIGKMKQKTHGRSLINLILDLCKTYQVESNVSFDISKIDIHNQGAEPSSSLISDSETTIIMSKKRKQPEFYIPTNARNSWDLLIKGNTITSIAKTTDLSTDTIAKHILRCLDANMPEFQLELIPDVKLLNLNSSISKQVFDLLEKTPDLNFFDIQKTLNIYDARYYTFVNFAIMKNKLMQKAKISNPFQKAALLANYKKIKLT
jgi:RecQ family ATP-dependent DNA helicase